MGQSHGSDHAHTSSPSSTLVPELETVSVSRRPAVKRGRKHIKETQFSGVGKRTSDKVVRDY
jgi:hypothetical protein